MMKVIFKLNRTQIYADKRRYNFSGIFLFFNIQKICVHLCPKGISIIINLEEKEIGGFLTDQNWQRLNLIYNLYLRCSLVQHKS